jgi:hypothetical protein
MRRSPARRNATAQTVLAASVSNALTHVASSRAGARATQPARGAKLA